MRERGKTVRNKSHFINCGSNSSRNTARRLFILNSRIFSFSFLNQSPAISLCQSFFFLQKKWNDSLSTALLPPTLPLTRLNCHLKKKQKTFNSVLLLLFLQKTNWSEAYPFYCRTTVCRLPFFHSIFLSFFVFFSFFPSSSPLFYRRLTFQLFTQD